MVKMVKGMAQVVAAAADLELRQDRVAVAS
jgi:hypothetical protein